MAAFDDHAGFGEIESDGHRFWFHCTQVLDGSRRVDVRQTVTFTVVAGHNGRWEASAID